MQEGAEGRRASVPETTPEAKRLLTDPEDFLCPIGKSLMEHPVVAEDRRMLVLCRAAGSFNPVKLKEQGCSVRFLRIASSRGCFGCEAISVAISVILHVSSDALVGRA